MTKSDDVQRTSKGKHVKTDPIDFQNMNRSSLNLFDNMLKHALENLSIFRSTYVCGQIFLNMNYLLYYTYIKNRYRSRLTDNNLQSCEDDSLQPSCGCRCFVLRCKSKNHIKSESITYFYKCDHDSFFI